MGAVEAAARTAALARVEDPEADEGAAAAEDDADSEMNFGKDEGADEKGNSLASRAYETALAATADAVETDLKFCEREGQRLAYVDVQPSGDEPSKRPVVLLIHGLGMTGRYVWHEQIAILTQEYHVRVLAVDLRGHGASVPLAYEVNSLYELVEDCVAVLRDAKVFKAVWCGSGLGSRLALRAGLAFPEHTAGLVLLGSQARAATWSEIATNSALRAFARQCGYGLVRNVVERYLLTPEFASAHPEEAAAFRETIQAQDPEAILAMVEPLNQRSNIASKLKHITPPTLLLHGERDRIISYTDARLLADALPDAELVVLSGVGHLLSIEAPRDVANEVNSFLEARVMDED